MSERAREIKEREGEREKEGERSEAFLLTKRTIRCPDAIKNGKRKWRIRKREQMSSNVHDFWPK